MLGKEELGRRLTYSSTHIIGLGLRLVLVIYYTAATTTTTVSTKIDWFARNNDECGYNVMLLCCCICRGVSPHDNKCWLYYPEDDCPFYRCTVFSHYAKSNCPADDALLPTLRRGDPALPITSEEATARAGPYWSLMFEVSENKEHKPVNLDTIVEVGSL